MYFTKTPFILPLLYPNLIWEIKTDNNSVYLTFDDGPDKEVTPAVLDILNEYNAKATFFCLGKNAILHPQIIQRITDEGHSIGNHTFSHFDGYKTGLKDYIEDVERCNEVFRSALFRPPYGRITKRQINSISQQFHITMWSVITGDFDKKLSKDVCLKRAIKYSSKGSIVVFHDSKKAKEKVLYVLPEFLKHFKERGFSFPVIDVQ